MMPHPVFVAYLAAIGTTLVTLAHGAGRDLATRWYEHYHYLPVVVVGVPAAVAVYLGLTGPPVPVAALYLAGIGSAALTPWILYLAVRPSGIDTEDLVFWSISLTLIATTTGGGALAVGAGSARLAIIAVTVLVTIGVLYLAYRWRVLGGADTFALWVVVTVTPVNPWTLPGIEPMTAGILVAVAVTGLASALVVMAIRGRGWRQYRYPALVIIATGYALALAWSALVGQMP